MQLDLLEWAHILIRWLHVFAGILWIGSTWFFTWLDGRLTEEETAAPGAAPKVYMVHSGGFYVVEKQRAPAVLPERLHWFKWEAAITWASGMTLLLYLFYWGDGLVEVGGPISQHTAMILGIGMLVLGWIVYDQLWQSPLGRNLLVGGAVCYALSVAIIYGLTRVLAGRAAYMQMGALYGTLMAANVWLRILPAQRAMIAATKAGKPPDATLGARAKQRSKHNTHMVVPVVFIMLSNHFPVTTYGSDYNWLVLSAVILFGWALAPFVRGDARKDAIPAVPR